MGGEDTWDVVAGVDALVERGIADSGRVGVFGGSYGGFLSAWLVTQCDRFAAAVPQAVVSNWISQHHTTNIPFFDELTRVLAPGGHALFAFSSGSETPIYVPAEQLRGELERRGFVELAEFAAGRGTAIVAMKGPARDEARG